MASKLLVNATAQACGIGRIANADLGLRQSEHVQVGLTTPGVPTCHSTLLCRQGLSTESVLLHHQKSLPASSSMGQPQQPRPPYGMKSMDAGACACTERPASLSKRKDLGGLQGSLQRAEGPARCANRCRAAGARSTVCPRQAA